MKTVARYESGFTLLELMIVVVIIAILTAIALPSYRQYVLRGHRTEATRALQDLSSRQENYYFSNNKYTSTLSDLGATSSIAGQYFTVGIASASTTDYVVQATAVGTQLQDSGCQTFTLHRSGQQESTGSAPVATCWGGN
ncbi:MAG TPA: type IV pilin protein [Rhodanobacter sp.]|nr:type IV pilin protein [Rhodanobacter sp.]